MPAVMPCGVGATHQPAHLVTQLPVDLSLGVRHSNWNVEYVVMRQVVFVAGGRPGDAVIDLRGSVQHVVMQSSRGQAGLDHRGVAAIEVIEVCRGTVAGSGVKTLVSVGALVLHQNVAPLARDPCHSSVTV